MKIKHYLLIAIAAPMAFGFLGAVFDDAGAGGDQAKKKQPDDKGAAYYLCEHYARENLNYPDSYERTYEGWHAITRKDGTVIARITFNAKNAFGQKVRMKARCEYNRELELFKLLQLNENRS